MKQQNAIAIIRRKSSWSVLGALFSLIFVFVSAPLHATEWFVNASAAAGGNGTSAHPFQTITQGVTAAATGDTVTVSTGTYRESVTLKSGTGTTTPFTLRAASGASVVVSGAVSIPTASWSVYSGTTYAPAGDVYTASASWAARDLFTNFTRATVARMPPSYAARAVIQSFDPASGTIQLTAAIGVSVSDVMSMFVDVYDTSTAFYNYFPVASVSNNGQTIVVSGTFTTSSPIKVGDTLLLCNHPSFIRNSWDWAYQKVSASQTTLFYDPGSTVNLGYAQCRQSSKVLSLTNLSNVLIQGLEIFGGTTEGININTCTNVTIDHCIVHECGTHQSGEGIFVSYGTNVIIQNSVVSANDHGVVLASGNGVNISLSHICYNDADGMDVTGRDYTQGQTLDSNALYNVNINHCYIHNHLSLEHPDNIQVYSGVSGVTLDSNFLGVGGQDFMTQDMHNVTATNNIFYSTMARNIILGHGYDTNCSFTNDTIAFGRWAGVIGMDSSDVTGASGTTGVTGEDNIIYRDIQVFSDGANKSYGPFSITFDYNLYWDGTDIIGITTPPWKTYTTIAQITGSTGTPAAGQESHSTLGDPLFMNAPKLQAVVDTGVPFSSSTKIYITYDGNITATGFAVGNTMEINADGVARTITANATDTNGNYLTFTPALGSRIFRSGIVWDWGTNTNLVLDLRPGTGSPALAGSQTGGARGSSIDLTQYVNGDYNGDGVRDVPADNYNWTRAWAIPYQTFPYFGIP